MFLFFSPYLLYGFSPEKRNGKACNRYQNRYPSISTGILP
ncbi:hypothetical protein L479_01780 [Exiguobacterium sp. S17]|nr:hypothetical protein L479_01780 [Exiguobacterium sp. S17]